MLNRKLLEIIGLWGKEEQREFQVFLASPYFNKGVQAPVLSRLYSFVLKYDANPDHPKLRKETVARQLFGREAVGKKELSRLDKLGTGLLALAEHFLAQKEYEARQSEAGKLLALMKFYRKHQQDQRFWQAKDAAFKAVENSPFRDAQHFFDAYALHFEVSNMSLPYSTLKKDLGMDKADQAFDKFFAAMKLEMEITKIFQSLGYNASHQRTPLMDAVRTWASTPSNEPPVLVELQHDLIQMFEAPPSVEDVIALEQRISASEHLFPFEINQYLHTCIRNVIIPIGHHHEDMAIRLTLFEILVRHLEKGYILIGGKISTNALRTFLTYSLTLGKNAWAKKLLEDFPPEMLFGTKYPEEFCQLNWAMYYFFLQDYGTAEKHLIYVNFEYQLFGLLADLQLLKIYYETQNRLLDARMKAFDQKIRRSTLTEEWKIKLFNFVKCLNKIVLLQWEKDAAAHASLLHELKTNPEFYDKDWLLEKLKNL